MPSRIGYYVSGNTAEGFVNFLSTNTPNLHHHIILNHPSHTVKTTVIQKIINEFETNHDIEVLYSSIGKEFLEGVIIRDKKVAVIDERVATADLTGIVELDLTLFSSDELANSDITKERKQIAEYTQKAYHHFENGLKVHDDLESIYINEMNFDAANKVTNEFVDMILKDAPKQNRQAHVYHRLFGTNTRDGVVNVVPELLSQLTHKYFIKGRAGTGKSTLMKKVMAACQEYGYDVELYHCSFDPNSVDMVLVRPLGFCIFDSTDPHEFFPLEANEIEIDMYEKTVTPGTDEKYEAEITKLNTEYKSFMKKGVTKLKEAGEWINAIEHQFAEELRNIEKIKSFIIGKITE